MIARLLIVAIVLAVGPCLSCDRGPTGGRGVSTTTAPLTTDWPLSKEASQARQEAAARRLKLPMHSRLDVGEGVGIDLMLIPGGTFPMGSASFSENPPRIVRISRAFLMSRCEITWKQFMQVVPEADMDGAALSGVKEARRDVSQQALPATVTWNMASRFCEALSSARGVAARLPSEAEWEYAGRAGTTRAYGEWDWIDETKANVGSWEGPDGKRVYSERETKWYVPVGQYQPNRWGLHDMFGNAEEWCLDKYSRQIDIARLPAVDPVARGRGMVVFRVARGGSFRWAEPVYWRTGDAASGDCRGMRLVVEVDDAIKGRLVPAGGSAAAGVAGPHTRRAIPADGEGGRR